MTDNQIFPLKIQGAIQRLAPPGRSDIEATFHPAMENGRILEHSLGDAMFVLKDREKDLQEKINHYLSLNLLAVDGQLPDEIRPAPYIIDSIKFIKQVQDYTQALLDIQKSINETVGQYQSLKQNIQGYFQERSNALATLLHEICNFNLPSLPSIPNFFANFTFDGFTFPKNAFQFQFSFDFNFAFSQCHLRGGDIDIFRNYPKSIDIGGNVPVTIPVYRPPFSGRILTPDVVQVNLITDIPYYTNFDPQTDFLPNSGMPNPAKIVSNYSIPLPDYEVRISSLVGLVPTLANIDASSFEPNEVAAWILAMHDSRVDRGGNWLPNFQMVYDLFVQPSYDYILAKGIVWNNVLGGPGVRQGDPDIPFIHLFGTPNAVARGHIFWLCSWIEASLLGYSRNKNYDIYQLETGSQYDSIVANYLTDITGESTDYIAIVDPKTDYVNIILDSSGKAAHPSTIKVSKALYSNLKIIVDKASKQIDATPKFTSSRPQFRIIYNEFAEQIIIDKYSQFWKEFTFNWNTLLETTDPYILGFVLEYPGAIDVVNPLGDPTTYNRIVSDASSRNRNWHPGDPGLPVFVPDVLELSPPTDPSLTSGWAGDVFDPDVYLLRADIQGLSLNQKLAMVEINKAYMSLRRNTQDVVAAIDAAIAGGGTGPATNGFKYSTVGAVTGILSSGSFLGFPAKLFDNSNYFVDGFSFDISQTGAYSLDLSVSWDTNSEVGYRFVGIIKNGSQILATAQSPVSSAPVTLQASATADLVLGDRLTVKVYHNLTSDQAVASATFSVILSGASGSASSTPSTPATQYVISVTPTVNLSTGQCLKLLPNNEVSILDPTNGSVIPFIDAIALKDSLSSVAVNVGNIHGSVYELAHGSFTAGPIFLGIGGVITQTQPTTGGGYAWYVQVGRAVGPKTIILDSQIPIRLL